jgi:hypothetical protein
MGEVIIGPFPDPIRRAIEKIGGERGLRESTDLILLTTKLGP